MSSQLTLSILGGPHPTEFTVAQWPPSAAVPIDLAALAGSSFFNLTCTAEEWSLVCESRLLPPGVKHESGWAAFKLHGPFDFTLTGILSAVLGPLRDAGVGIFALSTFDTDYVLVGRRQLETARAALRTAGHTLLE
jgi:uncharacterized protein